MSKTYNYIKFDENELTKFLDIIDVEKNGKISLGDVEATCRNLGLDDSYSSIKNILKDIIDVRNGALHVEDVKQKLLQNRRTEKEEMIDIFNYFDYDHKGEINKNKLKIIVQELTNENLLDKEAEEMIALLQNEDGVVDQNSFLRIMNMKLDI